MMKESLLKKLIIEKCMALDSLLVRIRREKKSIKDTFNKWKALVSSFTILGHHLAWKIVDGKTSELVLMP